MACLPGAFESSSRLEGASEMEVTAIKLIDSIALACRTISSDHVQIDPVPSSAIPIVYDDQDGRCRAACDGVRRCRRLRQLTRAAKLPHGKEPSALRLLQAPLKQATCRLMMVVDHGRRFCPTEEAAMVESCWTAFDGLRRASRA